MVASGDPAPMLCVGRDSVPLNRRLADACGGFAWWYLDALTPTGDGVVVIAALGLPFLPGYAQSDRDGTAPRSGDRPSINVAVYRNHQAVAYTLYEPDASDWEWLEPEGLRIGGSTFRSARIGNRRTVAIDLDCPVPGAEHRLQGTIRADGPATHTPTTNPGPHAWTPLTAAATAQIALRAGEHTLFSGEARVYHDRNGSTEALHRLGIDHWVWGRVAANDGEYIYYVLFPDSPDRSVEAHGFHLGVDGTLTVLKDVAAQCLAPSRGRFGMPYYRDVALTAAGAPWMRIAHPPPVDDGFFYGRFLATAAFANGDSAPCMAEIVWPHRVDLDRHRWLVRMAHMGPRANSMWLPLFSGPAHDRWSRLGAWWRS